MSEVNKAKDNAKWEVSIDGHVIYTNLDSFDESVLKSRLIIAANKLFKPSYAEPENLTVAVRPNPYNPKVAKILSEFQHIRARHLRELKALQIGHGIK